MLTGPHRIQARTEAGALIEVLEIVIQHANHLQRSNPPFTLVMPRLLAAILAAAAPDSSMRAVGAFISCVVELV
jgi:hypothetical protein